MVTGMRMLSVVLMLCASQVVAAETLPDPTRPAIDLSSGTGSSQLVVPSEAVPQGLQSIIISPQHRAAIINGEMVKPGDKVGDSRLIEVRESSVLLQNEHGQQRVMELFPKVSIKTSDTLQQHGIEHDKAAGQANAPEQTVGGDK